MRHLIALAGAAFIALATGTGAFAQTSPTSDNPNDAIPDALAPPAYGEPINIETAKKVAAAAIAETKLECVLHLGRQSQRRSCLFREAGQLPIRIDQRLAAQGAHRCSLSSSDAGVRNADRDGTVLRLSDDAR